MAIDPLKICCAYCGSLPMESSIHIDTLFCSDCRQKIATENWVTGGINAMVGKLVRRRIYFYSIKSPKPERWGWDDEQNADGNDPKSGGGYFSTFEDAVLDAWETLKEEKLVSTKRGRKTMDDKERRQWIATQVLAHMVGSPAWSFSDANVFPSVCHRYAHEAITFADALIELLDKEDS